MEMPIRKKLSSNFNPAVQAELFSEKNTQSLKKMFHSRNGSMKEQTIEGDVHPFFHCVVSDFVCDQDGQPYALFVDGLRNNLLNLKFSSKSNDLFKFSQTKELMEKPAPASLNASSNHLRLFCSLLHNSILPWLRDVTGVSLNDEIDMFSAQYLSTDCLLCHDDELEGRCFAYVYYLTSDWTAKDGGSLDLFNSKPSLNQTEIFDPTTIAKSIIPSCNSFVFFEVSPRSFHQVSEVLSETKTRLSLSGWFHGPTNPRPPRPIPTRQQLSRFKPAVEDSDLLSQWINPDYLSFATQATVQEQFVDDSEIQLNQFLLEEKFSAIQRSLSLLNSHNDWWELCGPANKCRYYRLKLCEDSEKESEVNIKNAISAVNSLIELFKSEEMFLFLSNVTGLSFHPMAGNSDSDTDDGEEPEPKRSKPKEPGLDSGCRYQLRKWCPGSYTLIRDTDDEHGEYALDLNLFFTPSGEWLEEYGGYTSYIANNEAEELLSIIPSNNCLAITYRDKEAIRFVKHVNHTAIGVFYDLSLVFYE